jgi:hypothetical protein
MSENIRKLIGLAPGFEKSRVPAGYQQNIGNSFEVTQTAPPPPEDMSRKEAAALGRDRVSSRLTKSRGADQKSVEGAALELETRFESARTKAEKFLKQIEAQKKGGKAVDVSEDQVAKPFNALIETVKDYAREAKGDDPVVVADMAHALMTLPDNWRDMVLRRAGNPEVFESLRGGALPEPDADANTSRAADMEAARGRVAKADKKYGAAGTERALPMIKRTSSHFGMPDKVDPETGKVLVKSSKRYKEVAPKGAKERKITQDDAQSTKDRELKRLAGDQMAQIWRIQDKMLLQSGYPQEAIDAINQLPWGQQNAIRKDLFPEDVARLPSAVGKEVAPVNSDVVVDNRLTIGTDPNYWRGKDQASGIPTVDRELQRQGRGTTDRILDVLENARSAEPVIDPTTGELKSKTVDLDKYFPWWRSRFASSDAQGNLQYPARMPTAEFVTGMIEGLHNVQDPSWFDTMLPIIQRSIDAAPDLPDPNAKAHGSARSAHEWSQMQPFLPSKQFHNAMQQGVGTPDFPYDIYGDRRIDIPQVEAPERSPRIQPTQRPQPVQPDAEIVIPDPDAAEQEFLRRRGKPGMGDQSSIYMVPQNSPMRLLLA